MAEIDRADVPANQKWAAQRAVNFLLAHYYAVAMAEPVAEQLGEDRRRELADFPDWAIEAAFRCWISRHNKTRQKNLFLVISRSAPRLKPPR